MEENKLIKLPISLGLEINKILESKIQFTPRTNKMGILSLEFTSEELALIDRLDFKNPVSGAIEGIELLPNLKILAITSSGNPYYTQDKYIDSISDKDIKSISKCINLESLEIENQAKISYIDVTELTKLHSFSFIRNSGLEEINGLDRLINLWGFDCIGNESLTQLDGLNSVIMNNPELTDINLDILLFPDAIGYKTDGTIDKNIIEKFKEMTITWQEILSSGKNIKINHYQMMKMHKKACEILEEYVPSYCERKTIVLGIEQYLCENIKYDNKALKNNHSHSTNDKLFNITIGPIGGANGVYNAFTYGTCVCEGYTRAMQYLLKLKGIKSHNVHCISGEDKLHMSTDKQDDMYKIYDLPDDGYHSIISIDDVDYLYDDPCWNACRYQKGDKTMPWTLLTKEEISRDHTLSFGEKNIDNNTFITTREYVKSAMDSYREQRKKISDISNVVYRFADLAGIEDKKKCDNLISHLSKLDINDSIDIILSSLNSLLNRKVLSVEQILSNIDLILALNPEKYKTVDDLIKRLEDIKSIKQNVEHRRL